MLREDLKDWEIAKLMFGLNTKIECGIVKKLRKHSTIIKLCEDYSIIYDDKVDDCGWVIPNECLKNEM